MKRYTYKIFSLLALSALWACEPAIDEFTPSNGTADFSSFVAVGDSYTAGFTDGALGLRGQEVGFAAILAKQLSTVGNTSFHQPLVAADKSVGTTVIAPNQNNGYFYLKVTDGALAPTPSVGDMTIFADRLFKEATPFNNIGVPGAKCIHLNVQGYSTLNPFFARLAKSSSSSMVSDALLAKPTFVSLWIGGNDVLMYALAGGASDAISTEVSFKTSLDATISALFANGVKGALGNVPDINSLPYFNYITYDALVLDEDKANQLNAAYASYNAAIEIINTALPKMVFKAGKNAFVIADSSHPLKMRQAVEGEKILLGASSNITGEKKWGSATPMPDSYVLTTSELTSINDATIAYNQIIKDVCTQNKLAFVDLSAIMTDMKDGMMKDGQTFSTTFVKGGFFSLDGIHATARGSAIIANAFIDAINKQYNAMVPKANVNDYPTVQFP